MESLNSKLVFLKYDLKFFLHNCRYYLRYRPGTARKKNVMYFVFEPDGKHPGLADRIKAIISLYNICKANGYQFKFYYETPFLLSDYLRPKSDWVLHLDELEYSLCDTRIVNETNWRPVGRLVPNKQYHCYCYVGNDIPWEFQDTGYRWHDLFQELFEPSEMLKSAYRHLHVSSEPFVSVHLRFVNALERFENTFFDNYIESGEGRQRLIDKCKAGIRDIIHDHPGMPLYVFSDSRVFLDSLADLPVQVLDSSHIGHTSHKADGQVHLKTFLDLYVMSQSKAVYRIRAKELYNWSCFALLAARMGNVPFYDKDI